VDSFIPEILARVRERRAAVVVAAPGAGKTTRIPPALAVDGPVILLQPRRLAARSIARRIANERSWTLGREVGWHVRFDRNFSPQTRLLVATEGILTARLQQDPLLSDFRTIVIDEFHERSMHADLGIALAKQAWRARDDLRIVVMSATLDAQQVSTYLGDAPVFDVPGRLFPLDIAYRPGGTIADGVAEVLTASAGQVLCFLPGAADVRRAAGDVRATSDVEVLELHGSMSADEQDRAIQPSNLRRVIVATNIAETSLTVPGVSAVVDSGVHKIARYDAERALDTLEITRISRDSAEQRAGRAGRLGDGVVRRLWSDADRLRSHREPEVHRIDLSGPTLDILSWGGDPSSFEWFEPPDRERRETALQLLGMLGAVEGGVLTVTGRAMSKLPVHPRLARILVEAGGSKEAAIACAILADRQFFPMHPPTTTCDLLDAVDRERELPEHVRRIARELQRIAPAGQRHDLRRALFAGYPDRLAQRRKAGEPRVLMARGHGAVIGIESGVRDAEYLVALDVHTRRDQSEARIRMASAVEKEWLQATTVEVVQDVDAAGRPRQLEREKYGAIVLRERHVKIDAAEGSALIAAAFLAQPLSEQHERLLRRLRFAGVDVNVRLLAEQAANVTTRVSDIDLEQALDWATKQALERNAPDRFHAPSGRTHALDYDEDRGVSLSIKLQELFGLAETPAIGPRRVPLKLHLLAPNGRPVQTTTDLKSFWDRTYPEVRKELRGRYPKHPWPEDPWSARPTARTRRRTS
jgi:ATP-dependent RNA helicase HrpB